MFQGLCASAKKSNGDMVVVMAGGDENTSVTRNIQIYDFATDAWHLGEPLPNGETFQIQCPGKGLSTKRTTNLKTGNSNSSSNGKLLLPCPL